MFLNLEMPVTTQTSRHDRVDLLFAKSCDMKTTVDSKLVGYGCKTDKEAILDTTRNF